MSDQFSARAIRAAGVVEPEAAPIVVGSFGDPGLEQGCAFAEGESGVVLADDPTPALP